MGFMGKLIKNAGYIAGTIAEYGVKATGEVIGMVAEAADKPELAEKSRKVSGGIAAGQAILHGIDAATTVAGSLDGIKHSKNTESKKLIEDKSNYVNSDYEVVE